MYFTLCYTLFFLLNKQIFIIYVYVSFVTLCDVSSQINILFIHVFYIMQHLVYLYLLAVAQIHCTKAFQYSNLIFTAHFSLHVHVLLPGKSGFYIFRLLFHPHHRVYFYMYLHRLFYMFVSAGKLASLQLSTRLHNIFVFCGVLRVFLTVSY